MLAEVAGPDQRAAEKKRLGHCTKNPSQVSWVDLSRDRYIPLPKLAALLEIYLVEGYLRQTRLAQANYMFQCTRQNVSYLVYYNCI